MTERRFTDAEVADIIERASATEDGVHALVPTGEGMTLAQVQEIGRDVGIAPQLIADAARALEVRDPAVTRGFLGMPLRVERVINLDRRLSDEEWERLVVDLREIFDARGVVKGEGSLRQWTNGNLQALLEPTANAQRIRLRTFKGSAPSLMATGLGILGAAAATLTAMVLGGGAGDVGAAAALGLMGTAGASMVGITALRLPGWARRRRQQMEEVASRVAALDSPALPDAR